MIEVPVDGKVATTFSFYERGFDGEFKQYYPTGFVGNDGSNAVWGMQFVCPSKRNIACCTKTGLPNNDYRPKQERFRVDHGKNR